MKSVMKVTKELFQNLVITNRLAINDLIVQNKGNFLGILWLWINPAIQIAIYAVVFGQIRKNTPVNGIEFFYWMVPGFIMWNYINSVITTASRSIVVKMGIVTKMKFPVSIVPAVVVLSELYIHILILFTTIIILVSSGFPVTMYWLQVPYYLFAATCFLYALSLFNSAFTTVMRDYQHIVYNVMRTLFFITPIIFPLDTITGGLAVIVKFNPATYLLEGYREALLYNKTIILTSWKWGLYFWGIVLILYIIGAIFHVRMRRNLLDYA